MHKMRIGRFRSGAGIVLLTAAVTGLLAGCSGQQSDGKLAAEIAALRAEVAEAREHAQRADDYIAIANLQAAYGYYVDKALWDQAADLFSRDATIELGGRGVFVGNDRVRQYLSALPGLAEGTVFLHFQMQPVITIAEDGKTANGRWRATAQIGQIGKRSQLGEGIYENAYVKEDGVWKISKMHYYQNYLVNFKDAWFKPGEPLLPPFENLPPDRPPTAKYSTYPGVFVAPFHYANPVSGRK